MARRKPGMNPSEQSRIGRSLDNIPGYNMPSEGADLAQAPSTVPPVPPVPRGPVAQRPSRGATRPAAGMGSGAFQRAMEAGGPDLEWMFGSASSAQDKVSGNADSTGIPLSDAAKSSIDDSLAWYSRPTAAPLDIPGQSPVLDPKLTGVTPRPRVPRFDTSSRFDMTPDDTTGQLFKATPKLNPILSPTLTGEKVRQVDLGGNASTIEGGKLSGNTSTLDSAPLPTMGQTVIYNDYGGNASLLDGSKRSGNLSVLNNDPAARLQEMIDRHRFERLGRNVSSSINRFTQSRYYSKDVRDKIDYNNPNYKQLTLGSVLTNPKWWVTGTHTAATSGGEAHRTMYASQDAKYVDSGHLSRMRLRSVFDPVKPGQPMNPTYQQRQRERRESLIDYEDRIEQHQERRLGAPRSSVEGPVMFGSFDQDGKSGGWAGSSSDSRDMLHERNVGNAFGVSQHDRAVTGSEWGVDAHQRAVNPGVFGGSPPSIRPPRTSQ